MADPKNKSLSEATRTAASGVNTDPNHGSVMPPLYISTNFSFEEYAKPREYDYTRSGNPTRDLLGQTIASLENGHDAVVTSSGMSALYLMFHLLKPGDVLLAPHDCYGGTFRLLTAMHKKGNFEVRFINQTDKNVLKDAFECIPKMILIETPSNPLLRITDIEYVTSLAKQHDTIVAADNTFLSPILQKPIDMGVDLVMHSTTKYINGHSDVIGGAVVSRTKNLHAEMSWWANATGVGGSPFDSYLTTRGLRTISLRVERQQENAVKIVEFLKNHSAIKNVNYPGLTDHPGHDIVQKQQAGPGAMFSFELNGNEDNIRTFLKALSLYSLCVSLGGVESLICHPATMTHAAYTQEARDNAGISHQLIRISAGIESADDLINDLKQALDIAVK